MQEKQKMDDLLYLTLPFPVARYISLVQTYILARSCIELKTIYNSSPFMSYILSNSKK